MSSKAGRPIFTKRRPTVKKNSGPKRQKTAKKRVKPFASTAKPAESVKEVRGTDFYFKQRLSEAELVERQCQLDALRREIEENHGLPLKYTLSEQNRLVFSRGSIDAALMVVGEAPGAEEAEQGLPFVGASGRKLDELLAKYGIDPERHVYVTNIVMVRPPRNRDPTWEEVTAYAPFLRRHIAIIRPKVILCMGRFSTTVVRSGLSSTASLRGELSYTVPNEHLVETVVMNDLYKHKSNMGALTLAAERFCCQVYGAYHPSAILREEGEQQKAAEQQPERAAQPAFRLQRWEEDFKTVASALLEPALEYINAAELVKQAPLPEGFQFSKPTDTFYSNAPLDDAAQQRYAEAGGTLEFEVHSIEYHSYPNVYNVYGRTADDRSVCLEVTQPRLDFWIDSEEIAANAISEDELRTAQAAINAAMNEIADSRAKYAAMSDLASTCCALEFTHQRDYIRHCPDTSTFIKVTYYQQDLLTELKKQLEARWPGLKFYESTMAPDKKLEYANNIYIRGWVEIAGDALHCRTGEQKQSRCDLEYSVHTADVRGHSPDAEESGDAKWSRTAPIRVLSLDGEMLNIGGRFPRAEQDPIVSICAYSATANRPDGMNFIEKLRNTAPGKSDEMKITGRSSYDDAVAFAVGSVDSIATEKFHVSYLPNVPEPPIGEVLRLKRGVEPDGSYKKNYVLGIRKWNQWIERFTAWRKAVGRRRTRRVLKDERLCSVAVALGERPDGTNPAKNWSSETIAKWEDRVQEIRKLWHRRAKKDIRNFTDGNSWAEESAALERPAREEEFGEIEARWELFRPKKNVYAFETEEDMLRGFYSYTQQYDADVITGYNIAAFDLPYFIRRTEVLDIRDPGSGRLISLGRFAHREDKDVVKVSYSKATGERVYHTTKVPGRDCYDFMNYVMRDHKLQSYQLAFVSQSFLGDTKNDVPYSAIPSLFRNNRERLNDYCLKDAELVLMLMSYHNNMNFLTALARLIGTIALERLYVDGKQAQAKQRCPLTHRCSHACVATWPKRACTRWFPTRIPTASPRTKARMASPTRALTCLRRKRLVSIGSCCSASTMPRSIPASSSLSTSATTWPARRSTCSRLASGWTSVSERRGAFPCPASAAKS